MKHLVLISALAALLIPGFSLASEEFDPSMFNPETEMNSETQPQVPEPLPYVDESYFDFGPETAEEEETAPAPQTPVAASEMPEEMPIQPALPTVPGTPPSSLPLDQTLTDTFKQDESEVNLKDAIPIPKVQGTWVEKLKESNPLDVLSSVTGTKTEETAAPQKPGKGNSSLEKMVQKSKLRNARSNASVFDISGVMLRMSLEQVDKTMQNRGFRKTIQKYQIPNFIKWRNEEGCRNSGVVGYERVEACVVERAKHEKQQYVQTTKYMKYDTQEEVEVTFTSNFTDNKVYKIVYKSLAPKVTGNSAKAVYLRNIKIYDFWKKINQKYGAPDNKTDVTWGMGGNKPYLKAKTGWLLLEDPMFRELDYTRMSREDQRYMNTDLYSF